MIKPAIHKIILALCFLTLLSCGKDKEKDTSPAVETKTGAATASPNVKHEATAYDFSKFEISKGKLGSVKLGMSMSQADALLTDFTKEEADAYDYGFDGGGTSYVYSYNGKKVLALIADRNKGMLICIVAIDKNLTTSKGLHPGMTAQDLFPLYPNVKVHFNAMMQWENITDDVNGYTIVFTTGDKNRVGVYKNAETPSLPKRLDIKSNWITIAKPVVKNDCSILHDGVFKYKDSDGADVTVKINGDSWTEEHKGGKYITLGKLKWKSNCEYENMLLMSSLPNFKLPPGTVMNVTVDQVKGFDVYFTATAEGKSYHGKMTKV